MRQCVVSIVSAAMLSAAFMSQASASIYSAEARVFGTSSTIPSMSESDAGTAPVSVLTGSTDSMQTGTNGAAGASSGQGEVFGTSVTNSSGGRLIGYAKASATFDDVLFSWTGAGDAPAPTVRVGLNYNLSFEQTASGPLGTQNGRNYRQVVATVVFNSLQDELSATFDVGGNTISPGIGNRTLTADVPLGSAVTVKLDLEVASAAYMAALPGPTTTSMFGTLRVGSVDVSASSALRASSGVSALDAGTGPSFSMFAVDSSLLVFDLPDGYTANSVSMGVVDNVWVVGQVPEPATVVTMLAGLLLVAAAARRTRYRA